MTEYVPLETLLRNTKGSIFKLVVLCAKRSLDVAEGKKPMVETTSKDKPIEVVFREIAAGKITYK